MNEQTSYAFIGETIHATIGRYTIGNHYLCIKDDSLLDTQILLIDDNGELHWEDCHNFQCNLTPILCQIIVEYTIDMHSKQDYLFNLVFYDEMTDNDISCEVIKRLSKRSTHPLSVKKIVRGCYDGL